MRVLVVSWEYPPVVIGGLGRHVAALSAHLVEAGHDVVVLSRQPAGTDAATHPTQDVVAGGVRVLRVPRTRRTCSSSTTWSGGRSRWATPWSGPR